eukprot:102809-Prymnesium_polylepis.1
MDQISGMDLQRLRRAKEGSADFGDFWHSIVPWRAEKSPGVGEDYLGNIELLQSAGRKGPGVPGAGGALRIS